MVKLSLQGMWIGRGIMTNGSKATLGGFIQLRERLALPDGNYSLGPIRPEVFVLTNHHAVRPKPAKKKNSAKQNLTPAEEDFSWRDSIAMEMAQKTPIKVRAIGPRRRKIDVTQGQRLETKRMALAELKA